MSNLRKRVLVTGATGRVGRRVAAGLVARGLDVRGLSRDAAAIMPAGVERSPGDLTQPESLGRALEGVGAVFLYAQGARIEGVVEALRRAEVAQVVVLSTIDVTNHEPYAAHNRRRHLQVEEAIAGAGVRFSALRPGAFMSNAARFWRREILAGQVSLPWQSPIDESDIAEVAIEALSTTRLDGCTPTLTGPESLSQAEQIERIARAVGRPIEVLRCAPDEARARLGTIVPPAYVDLLLAQWEEETRNPALVTDEVRRITGRAPVTYAEYAQREWRIV